MNASNLLISQRGPGLFKVNCSLLEDPNKQQSAKVQIDTMMQQMDHMQLECFKMFVRTTLSQLGQITGIDS